GANSGESFGIIEYDWVWNIGDRTSLVSNGWFDPMDNGGRVFNVGAYINRPDRTSLYLGYREIDPLNSQAVVGAVTYVFSPKYAITASTTYDFGINTQVNSLVLTRIGTDLQVSLGLSDKSLLTNFRATFEIVPNVVSASRRVPGMFGMGLPSSPGR